MRFRRLILFVAFTSLTLCSACLNAVRVHRDAATSPTTSPAEAVDGIPFYVKKGVCIQETSYLERVVQATLQIRLGSDVVFSETKIVPDHAFMTTVGLSGKATTEAKDAVDRLKDVVDNFNSGAESDLGELMKEFQALKTSNLEYPEGIKDYPLVRNVSRQHAFVDYSRQYFINAERPWIGSASLNAELAPDGTLTKEETAVEDRTAEALLTAASTVIPVLDNLLGGDGEEVPEETMEIFNMMMQQGDLEGARLILSAVTPQRRASLSLQPIEILHTFSGQANDQVFPCLVAGNPLSVDSAPSDVRYERRVLSPAGADKGKASSNNIKVSGEVVLPKKSGSDGR